MAWTYENVVPSLIPNTIMQKGINEAGQHKVFTIRAMEGYVLHDTNYDTFIEKPFVDEVTGEETTILVPALGYHTGLVSCPATYAFTPVQVIDDAGNTHTAYGSRQFFTMPVGDAPADQIFGVTTEPEIM